MPRECQFPGLSIDSENRQMIGALITAVEKTPRRIEIEASWVVAARPLFAHKRQLTIFPHGKDPNAVMQAIAGINKLAIRRDQDFRAKVTAGKSFGQS